MDSGNFVITEVNTLKCIAMLMNFSLHSRKLEVGQSIQSQKFEMKLPQIGKSLWTLILFPNGQYEFERDNGQFSVYLKMISCEHANEQLVVDVKFFLDSEETFNKVLVSSTFHYQNTRTRWVGTKLIGSSELKTQAKCGHLIRGNNLVVGFRFIQPVVSNDYFQVTIPSKETEWKQTKSWSNTSMYSNSSVIDVYRPPEASSKPPSVRSLPEVLSSDKAEPQSTSNESIATSNSTIQREKQARRTRLFCW